MYINKLSICAHPDSNSTVNTTNMNANKTCTHRATASHLCLNLVCACAFLPLPPVTPGTQISQFFQFPAAFVEPRSPCI